MLTDKNFTEAIKKEGEKYVKKVWKIYNCGGVIYSKVGEYNVCIGNNYGSCDCISDSYCKHLYALLLKYKSNKIEDQLDKLNSLSKKEIIKTIKDFVILNPNVVLEVGKSFYKTAENTTDIEQIMLQIEICTDTIHKLEDGTYSEEEYDDSYVKYDKIDLESGKLNDLDEKLFKLIKANNITKNNDIVDRLNKCNDKISDYGFTDFEEVIKYLSN